jgi:hypothetical protein
MTEYLNTETPSNIFTTSTGESVVAEEKIIPLLEERLIVNQNRHKIGEVIVRKQIETEMIQVPVRREKLIVEQIGQQPQQLAEIDLGATSISHLELTTEQTAEFTSFDGRFLVSGQFTSPKIASLILNAIALERHHGCNRIKIVISVENETHQQKYQEWFNRCSINQNELKIKN